MEILLTAVLVLLSLAVLGSMYRLLFGPSPADRIAALDLIGINMLAIMAVFSVLSHSQAYFDIVLLIGILTFIGTAAMAIYIERGVVIERGNDQDAGNRR